MVIHSKSTVSDHEPWITVVPKLAWIALLVSVAVNPLTSADMKTSEMLSAATVTTGAKMIPMALGILRYGLSSPLMLPSDFLNVARRMMNGEATI